MTSEVEIHINGPCEGSDKTFEKGRAGKLVIVGADDKNSYKTDKNTFNTDKNINFTSIEDHNNFKRGNVKCVMTSKPDRRRRDKNGKKQKRSFLCLITQIKAQLWLSDDNQYAS